MNATRKRQAEQSNPRLWEANPALAEPLQLPGVQYVKVSITGRSFERHLLRQLSWWDFARVLFLYVFGFRMLAASLLGRKVLAPRGLVRLGLDTLDASKEDINAVRSVSHVMLR